MLEPCEIEVSSNPIVDVWRTLAVLVCERECKLRLEACDQFPSWNRGIYRMLYKEWFEGVHFELLSTFRQEEHFTGALPHECSGKNGNNRVNSSNTRIGCLPIRLQNRGIVKSHVRVLRPITTYGHTNQTRNKYDHENIDGCHGLSTPFRFFRNLPHLTHWYL